MGGFACNRFARTMGVGLATFFGAALIAPAAAYTPGWYFGVGLFQSQLDDADGTATIVTPGTPGNPGEAGVDCLIPVDLLGVNLGLLGTCVIGAGTPGSPADPDGPSVTTTTPISFAYDNGFGGGFTLGYLFEGGLRPELNFSFNENDVERFVVNGSAVDSSNTTLRAMRLMANVWYDVDFGGPVMPYLGAGFGFQNTELSRQNTKADDNTTAYQLGAGVNFWVSDRTALSLDYRYLVAQEPELSSRDASSGSTTTLKSEYKNQQIGLALRYTFGEGSGRDSDGDGVPDRLDQCPNTPKGVEVYSNGCPVDLDGDGVPDYLDKCPNTPKGAAVGPDGCEIDSDGDGIPDSRDRCPDTPPGVKVDINGCPFDSDGDGVPDYLDKCPNTARGVIVTADGCPAADQDGDGIPDYLDKCPDTPPGIPVGSNGCPLDSDGDGIPDYLDECPHSPPGAKVLPNGCALEGDCRKPRPGEQVDANGCAVDRNFILKGVKFEFDSDRLTEAAKSILGDVASTLQSYPNIAVELEGHTDNVGSDSYNLGLSERRANAVKTYLVGRGVSGGRMAPVGYGESRPIDTNETEEGREENRRVELKVVD